MPDVSKYDAFISYRHLPQDKQVAVRLQKLLESYRPPATVVKRADFRPFRVFRDETELATSNSLTDAIREALRHTRFLVVVCSSGTALSPWCMEEIRYFKELHGGSTENIRVIVLEGEPREVIPRELCFEEKPGPGGEMLAQPVEPLALDLRAGSPHERQKKLKVEYLRIVATLLNQDFADLYRRGQRRFIRRVLVAGGSALLLLLGIIVYGGIMLVYAGRQRDLAQQNFARAEENLGQAQSLLVAGGLQHALSLNQTGARTRSAAILQALYPAIDPTWENAPALQTRFRDAALGAVYYNAGDVVASLQRQDEILDFAVLAETGTLALVEARSLCLLDISTGRLRQEYTPPLGDAFTSLGLYEGYVLGGLQSGGLFVVAPGGETRLLEGLCQTAIEEILAQPQQGWLALLSCEAEMEQNLETIRLAFMQVQGTPLELTEAQSLELQSDVRGDISCRYSLSENGRFLAAKRNMPPAEGSPAGTFDIQSKELQVLDLSLFSLSASEGENRRNMLKTVDAAFDFGDRFLTARYHIDNSGLLFLDLQNIFYSGSFELGYFAGEYNGEAVPRQQIAVYDVPGEALLYSGELLQGADPFYSTFLPVNESGGFLPYLRYNKEANISEVEVLALQGEEAGQSQRSYPLPAGSFGERLLCQAFPSPHAGQPPQYLFSTNTPAEGGRMFWVEPFSARELMPGTGRCSALMKAGGDLLLAGFQNGVVRFYALEPSHGAVVLGGEEGVKSVPARMVQDGRVYNGPHDTGVVLAEVGEKQLKILAYNEDRSQAFGYVAEGGGSQEKRYLIWQLDTGEVLHALSWLPENTLTAELALNADFSRLILKKTQFLPQLLVDYEFYEVESGKLDFSYQSTTRHDYFGFGASGDEIWLLAAESGVLQTLNARTGQEQKREYIRNFALNTVAARVRYHPANDFVVLNDSVYSFSSQQEVFHFGRVDSVSPDGYTLYMDNAVEISLRAEDLYTQLMVRPAPGPVFAEDLEASGVAALG